MHSHQHCTGAWHHGMTSVAAILAAVKCCILLFYTTLLLCSHFCKLHCLQFYWTLHCYERHPMAAESVHCCPHSGQCRNSVWFISIRKLRHGNNCSTNNHECLFEMLHRMLVLSWSSSNRIMTNAICSFDELHVIMKVMKLEPEGEPMQHSNLLRHDKIVDTSLLVWLCCLNCPALQHWCWHFIIGYCLQRVGGFCFILVAVATTTLWITVAHLAVSGCWWAVWVWHKKCHVFLMFPQCVPFSVPAMCSFLCSFFCSYKSQSLNSLFC